MPYTGNAFDKMHRFLYQCFRGYGSTSIKLCNPYMYTESQV